MQAEAVSHKNKGGPRVSIHRARLGRDESSTSASRTVAGEPPAILGGHLEHRPACARNARSLCRRATRFQRNSSLEWRRRRRAGNGFRALHRNFRGGATEEELLRVGI